MFYRSARDIINNQKGSVQKHLAILFILLFFTLINYSLLYAKEPQPETRSKSATVEKDKFTFFFDDGDVFSAIQTIFGDILKVNYIIDPQVKGRVNLRTVTPVAKEDILPLMEVILRLNGIGIIEENNLYRIVPISGISKEPTDVSIGRDPEKIQITGKALIQVVPLNYIQSSDLIKVLTPFISNSASIIDVPKSNHIVLIDTDANVKRLLKLIGFFDSEYIKQIKPQVFVYPVQNSKAKDIASLLQQIFLNAEPSAAVKSSDVNEKTQSLTPQPLASVKQTAGETLVSDFTKIFPDEITNSIIILAQPDDYALIVEIIKEIDIVPRQVLIEGLITRVDLTDELRFGIAWSIADDLKIDARPYTNRPYEFDSEFGQNTSGLNDGLSSSGFTFLATDVTGTLKARLDALSVDGKVEVMAAPNILVSDNREARIQVGQQIPIKSVQTSATVSTSLIQYKDVGIILRVKPQINEGGLISLEITQEVSSSATSLEDIASGSSPVINKTEASTFLVVQDGETIIIGGLMREDSNKSRTGIPILNQIPLIGFLFGSTTKSITKVELVIMLTPHVIKNRVEASNITSEYIDKFKAIADDKKIDKFLKKTPKEQEKN